MMSYEQAFIEPLYDIIDADTSTDLVVLVNRRCGSESGWLPLGAPFCIPMPRAEYWYQAIIKERCQPTSLGTAPSHIVSIDSGTVHHPHSGRMESSTFDLGK